MDNHITTYPKEGETWRAHERRKRTLFYDRYIKGHGIDIGSGPFAVFDSADRYDQAQGDATFMSNIADLSYDYVYSSHCLEHLWHPDVAIRNWERILKPGGHLIIVVPDRDYYEQRDMLPSINNPDHKTFWVPWHHENRTTLGLMQMMLENAKSSKLLSINRECYEGEYSIEAIARKV